MGSDFWEHSAAFKAWSENLWQPAHSRFAEDTASPRYMPLYFPIAAVSAAMGLDPLQAMGLAGALGMVLFIVGVPLFFNVYFRSTAAGPIALIVLLCGWGASWLWSNVYQLRTLFYVVAYPSFLTFSFSLVMFWLVIRAVRSSAPGLGTLALLALFAAAIFLSHPLTAVFTLTTSLIMTLTEPPHAVSVKFRIVSALLIGVFLAGFWPYFSVWDVVFGAGGGNSSPWDKLSAGLAQARLETLLGKHSFYSWLPVVISLGPALLGIPALIYLALRTKHLFAPMGAVLMLAVYLVNLFVAIPLGHRFILFFAFFCHVGIVAVMLELWAIRSQAPARVRAARPVVLMLLALMAAWNVGLAAAETKRFHLTASGAVLPRYALWDDFFKELRPFDQYLNSDAVVMAPALEGWSLPTIGGKIVAPLREEPLMKDVGERKQDVAEFFSLGTANERRYGLLRKYQARYVLYNKRRMHPWVQRELARLPGRRLSNGRFVLISVEPSAPRAEGRGAGN